MEKLKTLIDAGHKLIPLKDGQFAKQPRDMNYAENSYSLDDLTGNVGMLIPHGLVDVDFDWPFAGAHSEQYLPTSGIAFGRHRKGEPSPVTHMIYRADLKEKITFALPSNVPGAPELEGPHAYTVLELRTAKEDEPYHVMIPPSVHPSGEELRWVEFENLPFTPLEIDAEELVRRAGLVAGFAALTAFYPGEGARDDFATAIIGTALRAGWNDEEIKKLISIVARGAGDEEAAMRVKKVTKSRQRLDGDKKVRGLRSLANMAGIPYEWAFEIAVWLGWRKRQADGPAIFHDGLILNTSRQAWQKLNDYVIGNDPAVYRHGEALARVDRNRIEILDRSSLTHELNRCAKWMKQVGKDDSGKAKWAVSNADKAVVDDMLSAREADVIVPEIFQFSTVPMFTREGRLLNANGFDDDSGIYLDLSVEIDVPTDPTVRQVRHALRRLWEPVSQFPYVDRSDKVHVLAMMLEPYIRDMFDAVPMYFINKPAAGTGASLLIEVALFPTLGAFPEGETPPSSEEEMKKTLLSKLMAGSRVIYFDNANCFDSASLAAMITSSRFTGRILGRSQMATMPVRCQFVGSGNNTEMSGELYRRMVDIRIDAEMENPEDRPATAFRIKDLKGWVREHHTEQVAAALTIIRFWINRGMPLGDGHKASFEGWARVMSGIFDCINVRGFLDTPVERRPIDPELEQFRSLILYWFNLMRARVEGGVPQDLVGIDWQKPVKAKDVVKLCRVDGFELGWGEETRMAGKMLNKYDGRIFDFATATGLTYRLKIAKTSINGSYSWWVEAENVIESDEPDGLENRRSMAF